MDLDTAVPVSDELDLVAEAPDGPAGAYEIDRLLAGRFFTVAGGGTVSAWSRAAQVAFGFTDAGIVGQGFVQKLVALSERETRAAEIEALLAGDGPPVAVHIETRAVNADGVEFDERFAVVPIRLHDGYALNGLLQDIGKNSRAEDAERLKNTHLSVLGLIQAELAGRVEPATDGGEETERLVGALVIFDGGEAPAARRRDDDEEASDEDTLDAARAEIDELRASLEDAARGVEEAQHDAELAREEVEQTRAKLGELRGSADDEHDRAEQLETELGELRARLEETDGELAAARADLETARASSDEEVEALRGELDEVRAAREEADESVAAMTSEVSDLTSARQELAAKVEAVEAELESARSSESETTESLRSELEAKSAEIDQLATSLEAKSAEVDEAVARRDELAAKVEAVEAELESARSSESEATESLRSELEAKGAELDEAVARRDELATKVEAVEAELESARSSESETTESLRSELEQARSERDALTAKVEEIAKEREGAADELAERERQLAEARAAAEQAKEEAERRQGRVDELVEALQEAQHRAERAVSEAGEARSKLDDAHSGAEEARLQAKGAIGELDELRHQVELFRGAFDTAPIGMALTAPDGRFLKVNSTLCEELGYTEEQLVSDDPPSIVHPDDIAANREMARRLLAGEIKTSRAERRYMHADGHEVHMRESVALVRDGDETPLLFIFQLEDATEAIELGAPDESRGLGSASGGLPVPLGGGGAAAMEPAGVEGPFLPAERVKQALEDDQLVLYCQPVLDLRSNEISQYELLIRMVDEDGRLILPQAFLKPAEQAGLIKSIDHWVVRRAIRLIGENAQAGRDVRIEVNVSPESLVDRDLLAVIDQELASTPIDPANLVVEVTESAAVANPEGASALAKGVRALGARFALDDFGSTFGSFRHLKDLPLDYLKIDGELVGSLTESRTSQLVVKALVDVARGTGTETIAVFVSDDETLMLLRQHGVGFAQGYVVGRPQPLAEVFADGRAALPAGE